MLISPRFRTGTALLLACLSFAVLADERPDVRTLMTPEEFEAAGLGKLSPAEIEALNRWVLRFTVKDAPEIRTRNEVVREEVRRVETEGVRTRIAGEFRGWYGDTVFRLENGQTWRQRLFGKWYHKASSPEVELKKNVMNYWVMRMVNADRTIGVTRVD